MSRESSQANRSREAQQEAEQTAARLAVAGELTGAIAHEINQPLGAILSNAAAADLLLAVCADRRDELREILADIRCDDLRASAVIHRLRALLAKQPVERQLFDLNSPVGEVESVLRAEARRRGVALDVRPAAIASTSRDARPRRCARSSPMCRSPSPPSRPSTA